MSILIDKNTCILVQGMTGKEGQRGGRAMLDYGMKVLAGVTPGKGGQEVEGKKIFNSVKEAKHEFPDLNTSVVYVPPFATKAAVVEAIEAGFMLVNIFTERVPIKDTAYCLALARERGVKILGPSSLGAINPGVGKLGVIGGPLVNDIFAPGSVGVISRSGGMTNELSWQLRKAGMGQSAAVHVGGDLLMGTTYADLLKLFQNDEQTKAIVLFGEHGGSYEFEIAELIEKKQFSKPLAVYVGGKFASSLPEGMNIGHAGAIVERGKGAAEKEKALRAAGVMIAETYEDLVTLVKPYAK